MLQACQELLQQPREAEAVACSGKPEPHSQYNICHQRLSAVVELIHLLC